jgi:hypothetical protein
VAIVLAGVGAVVALAGLAAAEAAWLTPVNLSNSGSAGQPVMAVTGDGVAHVVWWDAFDGAMYAQVGPGGKVVKTMPVPQIAEPRSANLVAGAPQSPVPVRNLRLAPGAQGRVHALWSAQDGSLLTSQWISPTWSAAISLTQSAPSLAFAGDAGGGLRLTYVNAISTTAAPAGVYMRTLSETTWSDPVLLYSSPYFRTAKPDTLHLSVANGRSGQVLVTWDDALLEQSMVSRSGDGGATWSAAQPVVGRQGSRVQKAEAAAAPNGDFLLLWQDASGGGCGLTQQRSTSGGQTWSAPERVLPSLTRCPASWQFRTGGDGRLWLLGLPSGTTDNPADTATLAVWDGNTWSSPVDVGLSFRHPASGRSMTLGCLVVGVGGQTAAVAGCDDKGDVWLTGNAVPLAEVASALRPLWSTPQVLSDGKGAADLPALAGGEQGRVYAMWSQSASAGGGGPGLYVAAWDGQRWGRAAQVFSAQTSATVLSSETQLKTDQPAVSVDSRGRLHAAWSGGTSGEIMYSWVFGAEAASQSWAEPEVIPAPSGVAAWPDIVADQRGEIVHLAYAVPFNEARGIYYTRSQTAPGTTIASWLSPTVIFDAVAAGWDSVSKPVLALSAADGSLHCAWLRSSLPGSLAAGGVYYARSSDNGKTWSAPVRAAEGAVDWPRLVVTGGQVHLLWNKLRADGSAELWWQMSSNGGTGWSTPTMVRGFDRLSGPAGVAADGARAVHLAAVGMGTNGDSVLLYTRWDGAAWGKSDTSSLGQNAVLGQGADAAVPAQSGRLTVGLQQAVLSDSGAAQFAVSALGRDVATAAVTPAPTFTPLPSPTRAAIATPRPTASPTPHVPDTDAATAAASSQVSGRLPMVLGGVVVAGVIGSVVAAYTITKSRR